MKRETDFQTFNLTKWIRPFDQLTVVSLEQAVAAPFATRQLADLGARVIKIERPGSGDFARGYDTTVNGLSSYFVWLNRSKESVTLDLKKPGGAEILDRLLARADVFVQNVAPGASDRLGTVAGRPPRAATHASSSVRCPATGRPVPYATRKAYDLLVQSETGLLSLTGTEDAPAKVGISVADIAAGMYAYSGILAALLARASHGRGAVVDVSLFDALAEWMGAPAAYTEYGGSAPTRTGPHHASIAPYGPVVHGRWRQRLHRDSERARVDAALRRRLRPSRNSPRINDLRRIPCAWRIARRWARSSRALPAP